MPYHVRLHTTKRPPVEVKFDLTLEELETRILDPYRALRAIVLGGRTIAPQSLERLEIVFTPHTSAQFNEYTASLARQGAEEWSYAEPSAENVSDRFVTTPAIPALPQRTDAIGLLCSRFHIMVMQLRERHDQRSTLDVGDEYDVQDLMHSLLRLFFEDVRKEEWTPSYAGKASRMDFLLPQEEIVVETKKTRPGLTAKELGSQLIEDIARYKAHPGCKRLVCFVYDPEGRVANPRGIEEDLSRNDTGIDVKVIIAPKGY